MGSSPADRPAAIEAEDARADDPRILGARLALAVGRLNRRLRPSRAGLSHGVLSALASLVSEGPLRPGELARIERASAPAVTRVIARLEKERLVHRIDDPDDGRSFFVAATELGTEIVLQARTERADHAARLVTLLDLSDLEDLLAALSTLEDLVASADAAFGDVVGESADTEPARAPISG